MSDGLDHFDRDELVELHAELWQISIIREQHRDLITQAGFLNSLQRQVILPPRDCRGRHTATIVRSGVEGEATPAGADLQEMVAGHQL